MQTRLLENVDPLPDDQVILNNLAIDEANGTDSAVAACPMGIRNADGRIYRVVQARGMGETVRVIRTLQKLGFTEEDGQSPAEGCHSTFRRRLKPLH
jgi:hypothetical protein